MSEALVTDKGTTREINQDYLATATNSYGDKIYILCDGMGGYKGGEVASYECSKCILDEFKKSDFTDINNAKQWLYDSILKANQKITTLAKESIEYDKMGTTVVCLLITKYFKVYASVGDSRIYAYNHRELIQLSEDQTFANALLKAGYISEKEALIHPKKNLLICAIGSQEEDLDIQIKEITGKYHYLLCSDGLYNMVDKKEIFKIINSAGDTNEKANALINLANKNGGKDNVSVILVEEGL